MNQAQQVKQHAQRLATRLQKDFGVNLTHGKALELMANVHGYANWDTASAFFSKMEVSPIKEEASVLSPADQLATLTAIRIAIFNGGDPSNPLSTILKHLASDNLGAKAEKWQLAIDACNKGEAFDTCIRATGLFDPGVLSILSMVKVNSSARRTALPTAIEYLKTRYF